MAEGHLVIEAESYSLGELPLIARDYIELATDLLSGNSGDVDPNACFVLNRRVADAKTYAGTEPVGFTVLEPHRGDSVRAALFRSPDASYYVALKVGEPELHGRGRSSGIGDADDNFEMDSVRARRIGPPDRSICVRAAEAAAAELAARRRPSQP